MKEIYNEGYEARAEYILRTDNPYEINSEKWQKWDDGWFIADGDYKDYLDSMSPIREEDY